MDSVSSCTEKSFVSGRKVVLSVDREEFCHGQKKVLSWTENSSVSTRGRERDLSRTVKSFNMHRKSLVLDRENLVMAVVLLLPLEPLIKRVSNTSLLLVKPVLGYQLVGMARRNARG